MRNMDLKKKKKKDNIDFVTNSGAIIQLRWNDNEYRAYKLIGKEFNAMGLGAIVPDNLIEYIKEAF